VIPVLSVARQGIAQQCPERDQQVQRAIRTVKGDLHGQGLLPAPQRRDVRHGPVQPRQLQQASHHPASLAQWRLEKDLDRQAELDGRIAKHRRPSGSAVTRRTQDHILVDPDQQRPRLRRDALELDQFVVR
jgi:hypothetical protein